MTILVSILCFASAWVCFCAGLGICRFPDALCRLHASGKAGTLGVLLMMLALVLQEPSLELTIKAGVIFALFVFTSAQVAQIIGYSIVNKK
jgi:multicomponent Na+:H+ antiporter subunit G